MHHNEGQIFDAAELGLHLLVVEVVGVGGECRRGGQVRRGQEEVEFFAENGGAARRDEVADFFELVLEFVVVFADYVEVADRLFQEENEVVQ